MEDSRPAPFFQGYIKGTKGGIMGALKRTAVVRGKGNDIPNAYKWFEADSSTAGNNENAAADRTGSW